MKKFLFLFPLILLVSCGNNLSQSDVEKKNTNFNNIQTTTDSKNIQKQAEQQVKELEIYSSGNQFINTSNKKNLQSIEQKKLEKIANLKSGLYFYWLDCHKLFKLPENIKKCEVGGLKEAAIACDNTKYFKGMSPNQIFNKKKFDLLSDTEIQQAKQQCLNMIKQEQEEEKQLGLDQK